MIETITHIESRAADRGRKITLTKDEGGYRLHLLPVGSHPKVGDPGDSQHDSYEEAEKAAGEWAKELREAEA